MEYARSQLWAQRKQTIRMMEDIRNTQKHQHQRLLEDDGAILMASNPPLAMINRAKQENACVRMVPYENYVHYEPTARWYFSRRQQPNKKRKKITAFWVSNFIVNRREWKWLDVFFSSSTTDITHQIARNRATYKRRYIIYRSSLQSSDVGRFVRSMLRIKNRIWVNHRLARNAAQAARHSGFHGQRHFRRAALWV